MRYQLPTGITSAPVPSVDTRSDMGDTKEGTMETKAPQISLQSRDHEELLNIIDELRSQGISRYIDLPQIIVCGDQSSGKSSVLEAISGLKFPTKDNLCTRFATELILRRALADFVDITEAAEKCMGIDSSKRAFSKDVLRVELCGPKQPHLTLVDLPGLFHAGNKLQSVTDAEAVKTLVQSYIEKSRSIILAVVSAKNDYANQIVTKYATDYDPHGRRTLGIITKPDTLDAGSDSESAFVNLAENKDVNFRLGWHVLKNRDYNERECSSDERDISEENFFAKGIWTSLPPSHVGIKSLKPRLSRVLKDQILSELSSLISDVEDGVNECEDRLARLGASRGTTQEQRMYLLRASDRFTSLVKAATGGHYEDTFFGDPTSEEGYGKRLRAVAQNRLIDFTEKMHWKGHAKIIVDDSQAIFLSLGGGDRKIHRQEYIKRVLDLMKRTRGCELPSTYNPLIVGELFYEHAKPWQGIADEYTDLILEDSRKMINFALEDAADSTTQYGILSNIINPRMEEIKEGLLANVKESLAQQQRGHPITFNDYLTETVQKMRNAEWEKHMQKKLESFFGVNLVASGPCQIEDRTFSVRALLEALAERKESDNDRFACNDAINCMEAYYKVARKFFVDDFGVHCVEECLIKKLPDLFSPSVATSLDEATIEGIAAETEETKTDRASSTKKLHALTQTLKILCRLDRHGPTDKVAKQALQGIAVNQPFAAAADVGEESEDLEEDSEDSEEDDHSFMFSDYSDQDLW